MAKISKAREEQTSYGEELTPKDHAQTRRFIEEKRKTEEEIRRCYDFLNESKTIGTTTSPFSYTEGKINALKKLGIKRLSGFGSLDDMLVSIKHGTFSDTERVAVHNAYQSYNRKIREYVGNGRERQTGLF